MIGCGYLGAVHAACMTKLGHDVVGYDVDAEKIAALSGGSAPFFEPDLDDLLAESLATGRLTFTLDPAELAGSDGALHLRRHPAEAQRERRRHDLRRRRRPDAASAPARR